MELGRKLEPNPSQQNIQQQKSMTHYFSCCHATGDVRVF